MGAVYIADQISTGRARAVKVMQRSLASDDAFRQRFEREARIGAAIESEHVVEVVGAGIDDGLGLPWLAMELLTGETLASRIRRGVLSPAEAEPIFAQLAHALGAAHDAKVVHRDLKPENIFLASARRQDTSTTVKVLDFGIAKALADAQTRSTAPIGTALWMAPEQTVPNAEVSLATDVWALGLIAFYALTGRLYWRSAYSPQASPIMMVRELAAEPLPTASARAAELGVAALLPATFDEWFGRCVVREPERRYPHARIALSELTRLLANEIRRTAPAATVPMHASALNKAPSRPVRRSRRGALVAGFVVAGTAFVVVAAWLVARVGAPSDTRETPEEPRSITSASKKLGACGDPERQCVRRRADPRASGSPFTEADWTAEGSKRCSHRAHEGSRKGHDQTGRRAHEGSRRDRRGAHCENAANIKDCTALVHQSPRGADDEDRPPSRVHKVGPGGEFKRESGR